MKLRRPLSFKPQDDDDDVMMVLPNTWCVSGTCPRCFTICATNRIHHYLSTQQITDQRTEVQRELKRTEVQRELSNLFSYCLQLVVPSLELWKWSQDSNPDNMTHNLHRQPLCCSNTICSRKKNQLCSTFKIKNEESLARR